MGSEFGQQPCVCQQFVLQRTIKTTELVIERVVKQYGPGHGRIMYWNPFFGNAFD